LPPDIPPAVEALVMQMLVKDPATRFPNGAALAQAVGQVRGGHSGGQGRPARPAAKTRVVPVTATQAPPAGRSPTPAPARPNPATRVQPAAPPPMRRPATAGNGPAYGPGTVTANRTPPPAYPAARPGAPARPAAGPAVRQRSNRRTGLSVLLAVIVLVLAGLVLIVVNQLVGELSATGPLRTDPTLPAVAVQHAALAVGAS
jgi:serine/threonine-protein kinase